MTFLRGTLISDSDGLVVFQTIVPGWYPGKEGMSSSDLFCAGSMPASALLDKPVLQPVCGICVRKLMSYVLILTSWVRSVMC